MYEEKPEIHMARSQNREDIALKYEIKEFYRKLKIPEINEYMFGKWT